MKRTYPLPDHIILTFSAGGAVFADLAPELGCWYAARALHNKMLHGILRAPLYFFDVTPQGRVLARFSKDLDELDTSLPFIVTDGIYCFFEVLFPIRLFFRKTGKHKRAY